MKKAIVSGANGFVGTALCKELANQGVAIIAIVRNKCGNRLRCIVVRRMFAFQYLVQD